MTTTAAQTELNFAAKGSRAIEDLPYGCRCGARWSGTSTAHCGTCHRTFTGVAPFDAHRRVTPGECAEPAIAGLSAVQGRAYEAWGTTGTATTTQEG